MEVALLGPLEVHDEGRPLALGGRKQRAVLAVLALSPNRTLSTERLVDELWGEDVPETAVKMVQIYVSQLRKVLPADVLLTRPPGYLLELDPEQVDLVRFERLLAQGRSRLAAGEALGASEALEEALALWRGPALAEFAAEPFGQAEAARLEELHLSAVEERIEADLALGRHADLVGELEALVARQPLRERLRRQQMLALYRCGRQADALAAYQDARHALSETLGISPSPALRDLERQILNQDASLELPVAPVPEVVRAGTTRTRSVRVMRPIPGRHEELARLHACFEHALAGERRIVFVTGENGIGKTALVDAFLGEAQQVSGLLVGRGQCLEQRGEGEAYMPVLEALDRLCQADGGEVVVAHLADRAPTWLVQMPWLVADEAFAGLRQRAVGVTRERMLREFLVAVEALTAEHPLVLVLDDLHWSDPSTLDLLAALGRSAEAASLLVIGTYRQAEDRAAGRPLQTLVHELSTRGPCTEIRLGPLGAEALAAYLESRFPGLERRDEVAEIVLERSGGNLLFARNLVDAWVEREAIAAADGGYVLPSGVEALATGVPGNLRALIEDQLLVLADDDRELLRAAAVVGRTFTATGVSAGVGRRFDAVDERCRALAAAGRLIELRDEVTRVDGTVVNRYAFVHDLYREVLYGQLPEHARVILHQRIGERLEAAYGARATERAAELAHHFVGAGDVDRAVRFLTFAAHKAFERNAHREAVRHLRLALELVEDLRDVPLRLRAELELRSLLGQALVVLQGWSAPEVKSSFLRARELAEALGDNEPLVPTLLALATVCEVRGEVSAAQALVEEVQRLTTDVTPQRQLESDEILACSFFHQGSFTRALEHADRGLRIAHGEGAGGHYDTFPATLGDNARVSCHDWAALALWFLGQPDEALRRAEEAVRLAEEPGRAYSLATAQAQMTMVLQLLRDDAGARAWAEATIALSTDRGFAYRAAMGRVVRGWAVGALGDAAAGITEIEQGLAEARATGVRMDDPYFLGLLGDARLAAGRFDAAFAAADEALEIARRDRSLFYVAELLHLRARITIETGGDPTEAESLLLDAVQLAREQGARALELRAATTLARLTRGTEREPRGRELLEHALAAFDEGLDTHDLVAASTVLDELRGVAPPARPAPQPARPPIRYAKSDGLNIAYQVTGGGDVDLVLVPGFVSHLEEDWTDPRHARFLDRLGSLGRLIRFDKRGTGLSDRPRGLPDIETRMDDVRAVMEAAAAERPVVFGYSEGGPMSILFAATYPERVRALVLYGSYAKRTRSDDYPWAATLEQRAAYAEQIEREWAWEADMQRMCPSADEAMARWWGVRARAAASPGAARALIEMNSLIDVRHALPSVHVPTLVLHRRDDNDVAVEESRYIAERIPGARFVELEGTDHFVAIDPDQIVDEVEGFVAGVVPAAATDRVLKTIVVTLGVDEQEKVLHQVVTRFDGLLATGAGDGDLALFDGPARAVRATLELRRRLVAAGGRVRVGIHTGEVARGTTDVRGAAVDVAAAVAAIATAGDVLVSDTTRDIVAGSGLAFEDRGVATLPGLEGPRRVYAALG
jgi:DNA-binding SARP family transcriptional activator/pimeloyl-ACP methyl ester carboxylesterase